MNDVVETRSEFFMASQVVEAEHCKNYNVAGSFLVRVFWTTSRLKETKLQAGVRGWWRTSSA